MALAHLCFLAVLSSFLQQGLALRCYACNSGYDPTCAEVPLPASVGWEECTSAQPVCRVSWLEVTKIEPRTSRVVRACGQRDDNDAKKPCYRIAESGSFQTVCTCDIDLCNSSTAPSAATALMLLTLFTLWL